MTQDGSVVALQKLLVHSSLVTTERYLELDELRAALLPGAEIGPQGCLVDGRRVQDTVTLCP